MKKLSFGMFMALLAIGIAFMGCPIEADDGGGSDPNDVLPDTGQAGQTYTVTFKSNYLGVMADVADITVQAEYGESLGLKLPATGTINFDNPDRPRVSGFTGVPTGRQFKEWNTKLDGSGITFTAKTKVKGNVTIYAIWEGKYNLSAQMYPSLVQLQYNSYGGKDAEGVYNYQAVIPISVFGGVPGKVLSGSTFVLDLEAAACYDVGSALSISLADASADGSPKGLSNVIATGNSPLKGEKVELLNKTLTTTTAGADASPKASALLISADLPIFTEKLPLYASISLVKQSGTIEPSPSFDVDFELCPTGSNFIIGPYSLTIPDGEIIKNSSEGSITITLGSFMGFFYSQGGLAGLSTNLDLSNYSKVEIEYTAQAKRDPEFKLLSTAFGDMTEGDTSVAIVTTTLPRSDSKRTETVNLTGDLSSVLGIAFETISAGVDNDPPSSTMTIYRITFKTN